MEPTRELYKQKYEAQLHAWGAKASADHTWNDVKSAVEGAYDAILSKKRS